MPEHIDFVETLTIERSLTAGCTITVQSVQPTPDEDGNVAPWDVVVILEAYDTANPSNRVRCMGAQSSTQIPSSGTWRITAKPSKSPSACFLDIG